MPMATEAVSSISFLVAPCSRLIFVCRSTQGVPWRAGAIAYAAHRPKSG